VGDELLVQVAARLGDAIRREDALARFQQRPAGGAGGGYVPERENITLNVMPWQPSGAVVAMDRTSGIETVSMPEAGMARKRPLTGATEMFAAEQLAGLSDVTDAVIESKVTGKGFGLTSLRVMSPAVKPG
jgi:hypothetical protein